MLRNNADARRCSYFELELPAIKPYFKIQSERSVVLADSFVFSFFFFIFPNNDSQSFTFNL